MLPIEHRVSPALLHVPLKPPRASVPSEGLFLALWQQFVEQRPEEWGYIMRTTGPIRQRAASVAASFIVFMGCNGGKSFTFRAEQLADSGAFTYPEDAYLAAWAIENKRIHSVNSGLRTVEYMLARQHPITTGGALTRRIDWKLVPNVTQEDADIVESMVAWWSSTTAHWMRNSVEAKVKALEADDRLFGASAMKEASNAG